MGGCLSAESTAPPPPRPANARRENSRGNSNKSEEIKSMVRVGSKVLKPVPNTSVNGRHGETKLEPLRASSYDHVHNMVISNFEGGDVKKRKAGVVGLQNLGNTCFLNSSLQCLSNTIPLTDYFLGYDFRHEINYSNVLGTRGQLATAYTDLIKELWLGTRRPVEPSAFKNRLCHFAPQFAGGYQHDAQECLAFLLDGIHEDLNRVKTRPYIEDKDCDGTNDEGDAIAAWQNYLQRNRSIIVDLLQGQLRSTMTCGKCGHRNIKFEPFMYLSVPISKHCHSLDDCLDLFCAEEHLRGDNQWYCSMCRTHVDATKRLDLWIVPPILIVHLKRFDHSGRKIEKPIHCPVENWDLSHAVKSKVGLSPVFDLYAVSNHSGNLSGGHYTAFVKNRFDEMWYEMNDSRTRKLDAETELEKNPKAYCLFYNRVEQQPGGNGGKNHTDVKVRRQSSDRPELWPHMQLTTEFKSFRRSTTSSNNSTLESLAE